MRVILTILKLLVGLFLIGVVVLGVMRVLDDSRLRRIWNALAASEAPERRFTADMVSDLPEPARRYLLRSIQPGIPLFRGVELAMNGTIKLDSSSGWIPFRATQILAGGRGFLWTATVGSGVQSVEGADYFYNGRGRVRFHLFKVVPVVREAGMAVDRSAAGRLGIESVWLPTMFLPLNGAEWEMVDEQHARVSIPVDDGVQTITLTIDDEGRLLEAEMLRYASDTRRTIPFGVTVVESRNVDGLVIPTNVRVGWGFGTDDYDEFFRAEIVEVAFH